MNWDHEPKIWRNDGDTLRFTVEPRTDYWRITHYDFIRDSGPFAWQEVAGDFETSVRVAGAYREQFHQAGLMVRIDERNWIKTGIEYVDGRQNVSAVVTREFSDWSVVPLGVEPPALWLKLLRKQDYVEIRYSVDGETYEMLRLAYFPPDVPAKIGLVAAAPGEKAFEAVFECFRVLEV